jgi:hypothetical protein
MFGVILMIATTTIRRGRQRAVSAPAHVTETDFRSVLAC